MAGEKGQDAGMDVIKHLVGLVINVFHFAYNYLPAPYITIGRMLEDIKAAPYEHAVTYLVERTLKARKATATYEKVKEYSEKLEQEVEERTKKHWS